MATLKVIPQGVREGISAKSQKSYKFYSYFLPKDKKFASSSTELKAGDKVFLTISDDGKYTNLIAGTAFEVEVAE